MSNIESFNNFITKILSILSIIELFFFPTYENIVAILIVILGWEISKRGIFLYENIDKFPMATMMSIGFVLFYVILPLPATLIELKPITYNMTNSNQTFFHILICLCTISLALKTYKQIHPKCKLRRVWLRLGVFKPMTLREIYILSFITFSLYVYSILAIGRWQNSGDFNYIIFFSLFKDTPILLLFPQFLTIRNFKRQKSHIVLVVIYSIFLFIVGIATNVRTAAVIFVAEIVILVFYLFLAQKIKIKIRKNILLLLLFLGYFFTGPFQDISLAMVIVRGEKNNISGYELFNKTLSMYKDKQKLAEYRSTMIDPESANDTFDWDEHYLDNTLLSRFCGLKIIDMSIANANKIGYANIHMQYEFEQQLLAMLPSVICQELGMNKEKRERIQGRSLTDYMYSLATNGAGLGSFKIGSYSGLGLAIFGYMYPAFLFIIILCLFYLYESLVININGEKIYSVISILLLFQCFYLLNCGHNYQTELRIVIRGIWESMFTFILIRSIISKLSN